MIGAQSATRTLHRLIRGILLLNFIFLVMDIAAFARLLRIGEIAFHFLGRKSLDKPLVLVFPQLSVCLDCGFTEFSIPETELCVLNDGIGPSAAAS